MNLLTYGSWKQLVWVCIASLVFVGISSAYASSDTTSLRLDQGVVRAEVVQTSSRLDVNVSSTASASLACQMRLGSTTLAGLSCKRSLSMDRSQELSIYIQLWSSQGTLRYDTQRQRFVASIDAWSQSQQPTPGHRESLSLGVSSSSLFVDQDLSFTLKTYRNNVIDTSNRHTIRFEIYKQEGTRYLRASSLDYRLSQESYRMTSSAAGIAQLKDVLRFYRSGRYMIRAISLENAMQDEVVVQVRDRTSTNPSTQSSSYYTLALYPRLPQRNQFMDLSIHTKDRYGNIETTTDSLSIEIQRRLLPDAHIWTTLNTKNVCDLRQKSYRFVVSDRGSVSLSNLVKCVDKWFYRIKVASRARTPQYLYFTILDARDFTSRSLPGFSASQKQSIFDEYAWFMDQVNAREAQYPRLASSTRWYDLWTSYYRELNKITYNKDWKLTSYRAYLALKDDFDRRLRLYR